MRNRRIKSKEEGIALMTSRSKSKSKCIGGVCYTVYEFATTATASMDFDDTNHPKLRIEDEIDIDGVTYPVTSVQMGGFRCHPELEEIIIPPSVNFLGAGAFSGCYSLKKITIPSVDILRREAFGSIIPEIEFTDYDDEDE